MKRFFFIIGIGAFLSWVALIRTDGFSIQAVQAPLIRQGAQEPSEEIQNLLCQKFSYLDRGRQCFVFESEDGKYVVKFFNHRYFEMPWYAFLFREKEEKKRAQRAFFYENSYEIAQKEFGEAILYLHLGLTRGLPKLQIKDRASRSFLVDLNQVPFVLQKKGESFYKKLLECYEKEGEKSLCRQIEAFKFSILNRIERGVADADSDVEHNWGFVEGKLCHLDPGRLYYDPSLTDPDRRAKEWETATRKFRKWLKKNIPSRK